MQTVMTVWYGVECRDEKGSRYGLDDIEKVIWSVVGIEKYRWIRQEGGD
jgi:hypothetical protein